MKIQYLGTGAAEGWPAIFCNCENCRRARTAAGKNIRTRAQALIDGKILMDFGPDTYLHVLQYGVPLYEIEAILVTHTHSDHFYPEELVMKAEPYACESERYPLTIYGNERAEMLLHRMKETEDDSDNLECCLSFVRVSAGEVFRIKEHLVRALAAKHDNREESLIYEIYSEKDEKRLLYANDTAVFPEETFGKIEGVYYDCVSLDCTMGGQKGCDVHMSLEDCFEIRKWMLAHGCADEKTKFVLTHFSHNGGLLHEELERRALPQGFLTAFDGMELEV